MGVTSDIGVRAQALSEQDLTSAITELTDRAPAVGQVAALLAESGTAGAPSPASRGLLHGLVSSGRLHPEEAGRHFVALSLAEAETIRRILHVRRDRPTIDGTDTEIALRYSPLAHGGDASSGDGGVILDVSSGWAEGGSDSGAGAGAGGKNTGAPRYQLAVAHNCLCSSGMHAVSLDSSGMSQRSVYDL